MNKIQLNYADLVVKELFGVYPKGKSGSLRSDKLTFDETQKVYHILKEENIIERKGVKNYLTYWGYQIFEKYDSFSSYYKESVI